MAQPAVQYAQGAYAGQEQLFEHSTAGACAPHPGLIQQQVPHPNAAAALRYQAAAAQLQQQPLPVQQPPQRVAAPLSTPSSARPPPPTPAPQLPPVVPIPLPVAAPTPQPPPQQQQLVQGHQQQQIPDNALKVGQAALEEFEKAGYVKKRRYIASAHSTLTKASKEGIVILPEESAITAFQYYGPKDDSQVRKGSPDTAIILKIKVVKKQNTGPVPLGLRILNKQGEMVARGNVYCLSNGKRYVDSFLANHTSEKAVCVHRCLSVNNFPAIFRYGKMTLKQIESQCTPLGGTKYSLVPPTSAILRILEKNPTTFSIEDPTFKTTARIGDDLVVAQNMIDLVLNYIKKGFYDVSPLRNIMDTRLVFERIDGHQWNNAAVLVPYGDDGEMRKIGLSMPFSVTTELKIKFMLTSIVPEEIAHSAD
jgi:hypothetical protein